MNVQAMMGAQLQAQNTRIQLGAMRATRDGPQDGATTARQAQAVIKAQSAYAAAASNALSSLNIRV